MPKQGSALEDAGGEGAPQHAKAGAGMEPNLGERADSLVGAGFLSTDFGVVGVFWDLFGLVELSIA